MPHKHTIRALIAAARQMADRRAARAAWAKATAARLREVMQEVDERCDEAAEWMTAEQFELFCHAELAKVDAISALLRAAIDHDRWPRELYFGCV